MYLSLLSDIDGKLVKFHYYLSRQRCFSSSVVYYFLLITITWIKIINNGLKDNLKHSKIFSDHSVGKLLFQTAFFMTLPIVFSENCRRFVFYLLQTCNGLSLQPINSYYWWIKNSLFTKLVFNFKIFCSLDLYYFSYFTNVLKLKNISKYSSK